MAKKPLDPNPAPEKGVFHTTDGVRIVKAHRNHLKAGWRVATVEEVAAAEKREADRKEKERAAALAGAVTPPTKKGA